MAFHASSPAAKKSSVTLPSDSHRPFQERKSVLRGLLDLTTGRYPRFLFGGCLGARLPVFHFHEAHPVSLEPFFQYLAENRYNTVTSDEVTALVRRGVSPGPRAVVLCFDDAWTSLWVAVAPLLERYDLKAIAYVSPERVAEGSGLRPQWSPDCSAFAGMAGMDRTEPMFATWNELRALHAGGRVDLQSHALRHAMIPASKTVVDFLRPGHRMHPHDLPWTDTGEKTRFPCREDLGAPIFPCRSRLSEVRRWIAPEVFSRCVSHVDKNGGENFFRRENWRAELMELAHQARSGRFETEQERRDAILEELASARERLETALGKSIRHLCFPWAVAGKTALELAPHTGYATAFSDRLWGFRSVRKNDPPYQLMRLKHPLLFCLPGKGRTWFFRSPSRNAADGLDLTPPPLPSGRKPGS